MTTNLVPSDTDLDRMERQLFDRIELAERESEIAVRPRRRVLMIAAVAAIAIIATSVLTNGVVGAGQAAQAAEVLHTAAQGAITTSDPTVAPGQFLVVSTHEVSRMYWKEIPHPEYALWSQHWTLYIPSDSSGLWTLIRTYDPPSHPTSTMPNYISHSTLLTPTWEQGTAGDLKDWIKEAIALRSIPATTDGMFAYLQDGYDPSTNAWSHNEWAWLRATDLLANTYVPSAQRAALYDAMTRLSGVHVSDNQTSVDGRQGVGISMSGPHVGNVELVIDPSTGQYLGKKVTSNLGPDTTAVTVGVVDSVPAKESLQSEVGK